jgi:phage FluMu protein Com
MAPSNLGEIINMPIAIQCPSCGVSLKAPDTVAGKRVKCPKCANLISVPATATEDLGFEVVDDEPANTIARAKPVETKAKSVKAKPSEDDDDHYHDDDDRPRTKKRRDDEDEEDPPRKVGRGKPAKKAGGIPLWIPITGGTVVLMLILCVGAALMLGGNVGGKVTGGLLGAPAGYSEINDAGIRVYLHGDVVGTYGTVNGVKSSDMYFALSRDVLMQKLDHRSGMYAFRQPGFKPGPATKASALAAYGMGGTFDRFNKYEIVSEEQITIGGQPALKLIVKEAPNLMGDNAASQEFFKDRNNKERERVAKEGKGSVVLFVVNGEWTYLIKVTHKLDEIDPNKLKTIIDSVKFN